MKKLTSQELASMNGGAISIAKATPALGKTPVGGSGSKTPGITKTPRPAGTSGGGAVATPIGGGVSIGTQSGGGSTGVAIGAVPVGRVPLVPLSSSPGSHTPVATSTSVNRFQLLSRG